LLYLCIPNDGENYTLILNNDFTTYKYKSINLKTTLMKKALLSLAAVIGMGFAANADVVSFETSKGGYNNAAEVSEIKMNDEISITLGKGSNSNAPKYYSTGTAIRFYGGNVMTFTAAEGYEITDITITQPSGGNGWNTGSTVAVDGGAASTDLFKGKTGSQNTEAESIWTGNATKVVVTNGGTKNNVRLGTIKVTYNSTVAAAVETPVISLVEGEWSFNAEITCATEGAEIYYTTDGTNPTDASTKYTSPFEVWEATTIKAIAYKDGEASRVASFEANPPYLLDGFTALSDFDGDANVIINANMHAVYQNGNYLYLECGSDFMLVFGKQEGKYTNGDTFTRLEGSFTHYNNQPQIQNGILSAATAGTAISPAVMPLEMLGQHMISRYVTVENVSIEAQNKANTYTLTDAEGNTFVLYNQFNESNSNAADYVTVPEGEGYKVTGFVNLFKETLQLLPTEIVKMETVETPVITPATSTLDVDTQSIEITCATEGAEIYYTLDGTTPTTDSELYTAPIVPELAESITVKAIAVKEGMVPSAVAEQTYKLSSGIEDVVLGSDAAAEYFNLQGVRVAQPAAGLYLRRCGDKVEKVVVK